MNRIVPYLATLCLGAVTLLYGLFVAGPYVNSIIELCAIYMIAICGLNLLAGQAGYPNLSQASFMAVGAYSAAFLIQRFDTEFWTCLVAGTLVAAVFAGAIGLPLLRLRGQYFAVATLLLDVAVETVIIGWDDLGGSQGVAGFTRPTQSDDAWLSIVLGAAIIAMCIMIWLMRSQMGGHLGAIGQDEVLSESVGIRVARRKAQAFMVGAAFGGAAGVLFASDAFYVNPNGFDFYQSFLLFVAIVVGGSGRAAGPLIGALFLVAVPEVFRFAAEARYLFVGIAFILIMAVAPDGVVGGVERLFRSGMNRHRRVSLKSPSPGLRESGGSSVRGSSFAGPETSRPSIDKRGAAE